MARELPFFQFDPSEWKFGRIQRMPDNIKVAFIDLMCKYWHEGNILSKENAELDFGFDEITELIKYKIIEVDEHENITIKFLDIQLEKITQTSKINSEKGKASVEARRKKKEAEFNRGSTAVKNKPTTVKKTSTDPQPNLTDKIRGDEMRKDDKRLEENLAEKSSALGVENHLHPESEKGTIVVDAIPVKTPKPKKEKNPKKAVPENVRVLRSDLKDIFMQNYRDRFNDEYYWSVKDATALIGLIQKIEFKIKAKYPEEPCEAQKVIDGFMHMVTGVTDGFIISNFNLPMINSKFNEIFTQIKNPQLTNGKKQSAYQSAARYRTQH